MVWKHIYTITVLTWCTIGSASDPSMSANPIDHYTVLSRCIRGTAGGPSLDQQHTPIRINTITVVTGCTDTASNPSMSMGQHRFL